MNPLRPESTHPHPDFGDLDRSASTLPSSFAPTASSCQAGSEPGVRPLSASDVFARWAGTAAPAEIAGTVRTDGRGQLRHLLGRQLQAGDPRASIAALGPMAELHSGTRIAWRRLNAAGVPELLDQIRATAGASCPPISAATAAEICQLVDRVMRDDLTAALAAAHARPQPDALPARRVMLLVEVLQAAREMPQSCLPRPASPDPSDSPPTSSISSLSSIDSLQTPESTPGTPFTSGRSLPSPGAVWPTIDGIDPVTSPGPIPEGPLRTPGAGLNIPFFERLLSDIETPDPDGDDGRSTSGRVADEHTSSRPPSLVVRRQATGLAPLMTSGRSPRESHVASEVNLPSLESVQWLPSTNLLSLDSPGSALDLAVIPRSLDGPASLRAHLASLDRRLITAAHEWLRAQAFAVLDDLVDDPTATPSPEQMSLLRLATHGHLRMTRVAHAPAVAGLSGAPLSRYTGDIETPAALVAWARQAQGREGVRRERWVELLCERAANPDGRILLSAPMLRRGCALPPMNALLKLVPPDSLNDRGTLIWRGERLHASDGMAKLLDRLGVRHIDIATPPLSHSTLPSSLRDADISVVTLHHTHELAPADLARRIGHLSGALPSLYLIRLPERGRSLPPDALPPDWTSGVEGVLFHRRRNANRQRLEPIRALWPEGRLPPALRARAVNVLPDGEPVLDYIANVRQLRAVVGEFSARDIAFCAHLATIVDGLATDTDFARRCRAMVEQPVGPCVDAGMLTLSAMSAMRDATEASSLSEVAGNAFVQACLARVDADCVQRQPDFDEVLEEAMVLRWHVSRVLAGLLGADRVRVADKPVFGAVGAGDDWNSATRSEKFQEAALALVTAESDDDCPGVVLLLSVENDPLGDMLQSRVDQEPACRALREARQEVLRDYERLQEEGEDGGEDEALQAATFEKLKAIDAALHQTRLDTLLPELRHIRARLATDVVTEPPTKRQRMM